jgi:hypothetical protein
MIHLDRSRSCGGNSARGRAEESKRRRAVKLDTNMNANPMTYAGKFGKQYVAGVSQLIRMGR